MDQQEEWLREQFERCWPYIYAAISKMNEPYGREYLEKRIFEDHDAQFWPGMDCGIVTEIEVRQDGSKVLVGWLAGGSGIEIESMTPRIEAWGKSEGCVLSRLIQRPAYSRRPKPGYRMTAVVMEKEL